MQRVSSKPALTIQMRRSTNELKAIEEKWQQFVSLGLQKEATSFWKLWLRDLLLHGCGYVCMRHATCQLFPLLHFQKVERFPCFPLGLSLYMWWPLTFACDLCCHASSQLPERPYLDTPPSKTLISGNVRILRSATERKPQFQWWIFN